MGILRAGLAIAVLAGWSLPAKASEPAESEARGARVYSELCTTCHGRYGRGDGPLASNLAVRPPDFSDSAWLADRSDDAIVSGLRGRAHMSMAVAAIVDEQSLRDAVAYIRRLSVPGRSVSLLQGRDIYQASCWVCHGRDGKGDGPAVQDLADPRPRDFSDPAFVIAGREDEIARAIALGPAAAFHGSSFMPEWSSRLTPRQIEDVVAYLQTFRGR